MIHLYKEGKFYVAYQYSACLIIRHIKPVIQLMRRTRKGGISYLRVGLPVEPKALAPSLRLNDKGAPVLGLDILVEEGLGLTFVLEECEVDLDIGKERLSPVELDNREAVLKVLLGLARLVYKTATTSALEAEVYSLEHESETHKGGRDQALAGAA